MGRLVMGVILIVLTACGAAQPAATDTGVLTPMNTTTTGIPCGFRGSPQQPRRTHVMVSASVKIPPQDGDSLGFDLREVMAAVGVHGDLAWHLKGAWFVYDEDLPEAVLAPWERIEEQSRTPAGVQLSWSDMESCARVMLQVIDGTFTGYQGEEPILQLAAIDSSYWIVWARASDRLDLVRHAFDGVLDYDEPPPPQLRT